MKLIPLLFLTILSCTPKRHVAPKVDSDTKVIINHLSQEIPFGLNEVTIDTIHILIYRGVQSCTMIKL